MNLNRFSMPVSSKQTAAGLKGKNLEVLWTRDFPAKIAMPVVADIDGDGKLEILISCANGKLYALGARKELARRAGIPVRHLNSF
jgi:hypothetical protein